MRGFKAPSFPMKALFESRADNVRWVAAALLLVSIVPDLNASVRSGRKIGPDEHHFLTSFEKLEKATEVWHQEIRQKEPGTMALFSSTATTLLQLPFEQIMLKTFS
ncbi:Hypothetical predicted protein [Olea europaea subsp. europaea]|uniref:Uncharacterized protein n=1 Tax=Olea europaea subsp. europaea TaxID=158383 RepID=A0A8S0UM70_OLEEU|nr:Hypothetical predicted protein [Olea europaea subsp. europaea]